MSSAPATSRPTRCFRPGALLTVLTLACLALLLWLGTWQVQRLQWKLDLIGRAERGLELPAVPLPSAEEALAALDYRRVTVEGELLGDRAVGFGTRAAGGRVGAVLLTPLRLADGRVLMVERGWLPEDRLPPDQPDALRARRDVALEGVLRWHGDAGPNAFTPENRPDARRWFWLDAAGLASWLGMPVLPASLVVEESEGGLVPQPVVVSFRNDHLGYAITWYSLAAALIVFYVLLGFKRGES